MNIEWRQLMMCVSLISAAVAHAQNPFQNCEDLFCASAYARATALYEKKFADLDDIPEAVLARAKSNYGEALLAQGLYAQGWIARDARMNLYKIKLQKPWDGLHPEGKTILIRCEGGMGDSFFFIRYVALLRQLGARTIVLAPEVLAAILQLCPYVDQVITQEPVCNSFDVDVFMMSLPLYLSFDKNTKTAFFATTLPDTIPVLGQYVFAHAPLVETWKKKLPRNKFKIGICWRTSPNAAGVTRRLQREISVDLLASLGRLPGVALYNLISGFHNPIKKSEATEHTHSLNVVSDDSPEIYSIENTTVDGFYNTAAVIENMDLIISVDTSISCLAAAMNKPVWFLLPHESDWRWFEYPKSDSPWYPTARLFWQSKQGDWSNIMRVVERELNRIIQGLS